MSKNEAKTYKKNEDKYNATSIENDWQSKWEKAGVYQPNLETAKHPFYNLMMFPYPSAEGLHVGSVFSFSASDIYGRFQRMKGKDVFEPIGLDGFGINSENHAIKTGTHPIEHAKRTEENFYRQLHSIGNGFDWRSKLETYDPNYYKWTQWLFIQLFKAGLAYRKKSPVNFCPSCKTVLADEQVIDGKCERCGSIVEKRELEQWFFRITNYADRLLQNIGQLNWTEKVKIAQTNWIGKKTGINITYPVIAGPDSAANNHELTITVFTTRPDTNFGATFIALAPDGDATRKVLKHISDEKIRHEINKYIELVKSKSEIERLAEGKEKTGVFTGLYAINQLTGFRMPIWISDFVLSGFGTGALVGVPGHDKRDFEFATKFNLEIKRVVVGSDGDQSEIDSLEKVQEEEGTMLNSEFLDGMDIHKATQKIMDYLEEKGWGRRVSTFRLRDWLISRQRYWGPPIPMVFCEKCAKSGKSYFTSEEAKHNKRSKLIGNWKLEIGNSAHEMRGWYPVPEEQLPVKLPYIKDYKPLGTGVSPLASDTGFVNISCPECGSKARRETDVSDTFLDSSWYFLRYLAPDWEDQPFPSEVLAKKAKRKRQSKNRKTFLPVTMYIGGAEHSVLHLMYTRFITMFLFDLGLVNFEEPFTRFYAHGLIIKDGAKMSKSRGNVVNPDEYIQKYGADTLRMYLHFLGPLDQYGDFRDTGIEGMHRFLKRVYTLFKKTQNPASPAGGSKLKTQKIDEENLKIMHQTIKGVTEDLENLRYNTAISKLMIWYNFLVKQESLNLEETQSFLKLLAPFAPHLSEELWQDLNKEKFSSLNSHLSIHKQPWPQFDAKYLTENNITIAVQVNGKMRDTLQVQISKSKVQSYIEEKSLESERVKQHLEGKNILKVIYIPGKVINFVVK